MLILNRSSAKAICLAVSVVTSVAACSAEAPEVETAVPASTVQRIDAGDGVEIELKQDDAAGVMGIAVRGPDTDAAKARVAALAKVQGGASELYRAALPGREVPSSVLAFEKMTRVGVEDAALAGRLGPSAEAAVTPVQDLRLDRVSKSAASFPGQFCGEGRLDTACAYSGWYAAQNGCFTTRTNDWSKQLDTVRQGFAALEMQVGSANLQSEYWDGGKWVRFHNVAIAQGTNNWVRLWAQNSAPAYYRFKVVGATGDTYHVAVQSADTPIQDMANKDDETGQKYQIRCDCLAATGLVGASYRVESCLRQPTAVISGREQLTHNDAFLICQLRCNDDVVTYIADTNRLAFRAMPGTAGCTPSGRYTNLP